ncbi:MAG: hypothetical protein DMG96_38705 [Acidobacteria bacterium]|nr:MAG: hypothetical protein DMG96_38705 [Acidobacteriota bacterium]
MAADDHAHDLSEGDLDGVGVLEHGQNKLGCDVMGGVAEVNSGHAPATMEVAIFAVAQRRGNRMWGGRPRPPTLFADVLTAGDTIFVIGQDECSTPPPVIYCNQQDRGKFFGKSWIKKGYR